MPQPSSTDMSFPPTSGRISSPTRGPKLWSRALWSLRRFAPVTNRYTKSTVFTPMSDGIELRGDLYLPDGVASPATIMMRSPYGRDALHGLNASFFASRGYIVFVQSCRGTAGSGGAFTPMVTEAGDAQDTVGWLRTQPWFDGRLVTFGASYLGYTQWALAENPPEELKGMIVDVGPHDFAEVAWGRGAFDLINFLGWSDLMAQRDDEKPGLYGQIKAMKRDEKSLRARLASLPLRAATPDRVRSKAPWYLEWLDHPDIDAPFWDATRHQTALEKVTCPVLLSGGWQDLFLRQTLAQWKSLSQRRVDLEVMLGPWTHTDLGRWVFDPHCLNRSLRWLAALLSGAHPVAYADAFQVQIAGGRKEWRAVESWPPKSEPVTLFLGAGATMIRDPGASAGEASFVFDPSDPTPTVGGHTMTSDNGFRDNRHVEARADVLTFTTPPQVADLVIIGHPVCHLEISSTDPVHDIFVRLCDVDEKGKSTNVVDEIVRFDTQVVPDAGRHEISIELQGIAYRFRRGHCIRLQVSGGAFPRFSVNQGSGPFAADGTGAPVNHVIFLGGGASRVTLPTVDPTVQPVRIDWRAAPVESRAKR